MGTWASAREGVNWWTAVQDSQQTFICLLWVEATDKLIIADLCLGHEVMDAGASLPNSNLASRGTCKFDECNYRVLTLAASLRVR